MHISTVASKLPKGLPILSFISLLIYFCLQFRSNCGVFLAEADAGQLESSAPTCPHTLQRTGWWLLSAYLSPGSKSTNLEGNLYITPLSAHGRQEGKSGMKLAVDSIS